MKRYLLTLFLILAFPVLSWGTVYYAMYENLHWYSHTDWPVSASGVTTEHTDLEAVYLAYDGGGHTVYLDGFSSGVTCSGTCLDSDSSLDLGGAGDITITTSTDPAHAGQIVLDGSALVGNETVYINHSDVTLSGYIKIVAPTNDEAVLTGNSATGVQIGPGIGGNLFMVDGNYNGGSTSTRTIYLYDSSVIMSGVHIFNIPAIGVLIGDNGGESDDTVTINHSLIEESYGTDLVKVGGTGITTNINNSVIAGSEVACVRNSSSTSGVTVYIKNSIIGASSLSDTSTNASLVASGDIADIDIDYSILLGSFDQTDAGYLINAGSGATIILGEKMIYENPDFINTRRPSFIIPMVDDGARIDEALELASIANEYGVVTTWAISVPQSLSDANWDSTVDAMNDYGMGVASHTFFHSDLSERSGVTVAYTGGNGDAIVNIVPVYNECPEDALNTITVDVAAGGDSFNVDATGFTLGELSTYINNIANFKSSMINDKAYHSGTSAFLLSGVTNYDIVGSGTLQVDFDEDNFFDCEIVDSKAYIQAQIRAAATRQGYTDLASWVLDTFAYPYNFHDYTAELAVRDAGYIGARGGGKSVADYTLPWLEQLNLYSVWGMQLDSILSGGSYGVEVSADSLLAGLAYKGGVMSSYFHTWTDFSRSDWRLFFAKLQASGTYTMTVSDFFKHARGTLTGILETGITDYFDGLALDSGTTTIVVPFIDNSNYRLQRGSPGINNGTDICATLGDATDLDGNIICFRGIVVGRWRDGVEMGPYGYLNRLRGWNNSAGWSSSGWSSSGWTVE